jgi:uncharacterized protein YcbK (DUF882 family)
MGDISKNFNRLEFLCGCKKCGFATVDVELIGLLEEIRANFGSPVTINSACRCDQHNNKVDGSSKSKHKLGIAADIVVKDVKPFTVAGYIDCNYGDKYGLGRYNTFTHIDVRQTKARWVG